MSEKNTQFIIDTNGAFFREDIVRYPIDPGPELEKLFKTNMAVKMTNLMVVPSWGVAHLSVDENAYQYWTVHIEEIVFKTSFFVKGEGETAELIPLFKETVETPPLTIPWSRVNAISEQTKPMDLRFMAHIIKDGSRYKVHKQYLYAFDDTKNAYRLPISNLYDTCELCNGEYNSYGNTAFESFTKALNQFRNSSWNSDLWKDADKVENFIRFKPLETGFQTLPIKGSWTKYCMKISQQLQKHATI